MMDGIFINETGLTNASRVQSSRIVLAGLMRPKIQVNVPPDIRQSYPPWRSTCRKQNYSDRSPNAEMMVVVIPWDRT